ncbi:MAG: hypothetical protein KatS3mg100_642 [Candidatus Parcubacteria bacterium]|nr:MAG: hypothetical protein KatS3mg100_642 [Candidatus Parcubacteria bacterium]
MVRVLWWYFLWHYSHSFESYFRIWRTILWGVFHFFSVPFLVRTLVAPLMRTGETYAKGFDPAQWAQTFLLNTIMRIVGMVARLIVLAVGGLVMAAAVLAGVVGFVVWLVWPFTLAALVVAGVLLAMSGLRMIVVL